MVTWVLIAASAAASAGLTNPSSRTIVSVTVLESGELAPQDVGIDPPGRCKGYRPTGQQVQRWFRAARRVPVSSWLEMDRSQCWARGTLKTADGKSYRWDLDQAGLGTITLTPTVGYYYKGKALPFKVGY